MVTGRARSAFQAFKNFQLLHFLEQLGSIDQVVHPMGIAYYYQLW